MNAGRYSALGSKYGTSRQQANRWCTGQAIPSPQILVVLAADLGVTVDWLFGRDLRNEEGVNIPVYRLRSPDVDAVQTNFQFLGNTKFLASSPVAGRSYAIVNNWSESLDPPLSRGEDLLVDLSIQELEVEAIYVIRTSTSTSVRKFRLLADGQTLKFSRTTPINTYSSSYQIHEVHYNASQSFDVEWNQPGAVVIGRVEATMRSLLHSVPSFISG